MAEDFDSVETVSDRSGTTDSVLRTLTDQRRRAVVRSLLERTPDTVDVEDLARQMQRSTPPDPPDGHRHSRLRIELHHRILPMLADHGFGEYDPRSGTFRYDPDPGVERVARSVLDV